MTKIVDFRWCKDKQIHVNSIHFIQETANKCEKKQNMGKIDNNLSGLIISLFEFETLQTFYIFCLSEIVNN